MLDQYHRCPPWSSIQSRMISLIEDDVSSGVSYHALSSPPNSISCSLVSVLSQRATSPCLPCPSVAITVMVCPSHQGRAGQKTRPRNVSITPPTSPPCTPVCSSSAVCCCTT